MYQPRAGRRAAPAVAAIDPLDAPTSTPAVSGAPSWLNDDSGGSNGGPAPAAATTTTFHQGSPSVSPVLPQTAGSTAPSVTTTLISDAAEAVPFTVSERPPLAQRPVLSLTAAPANGAAEPSWFDDTPASGSSSPPRQATASITTPTPVTENPWGTQEVLRDRSNLRPRAVAPTDSKPTATTTSQVSPGERTQTVARPSPSSPPEALPLRQTLVSTVDAVIEVPPQAPQAAQPTTVLYDDDTTVIATLERDLKEMEDSLEGLTKEIIQLENGTHPEAAGLAALDAQIEFMKKQKGTVEVTRASYMSAYNARCDALQERSKAQMSAAVSEITSRQAEKFNSETRQLSTLKSAVASSLSALEVQLSEEMKHMFTLADSDQDAGNTRPSSASNGIDTFAIKQLSSLIGVFVSDAQSQWRQRARDVLREETRMATDSAAVERAKRLEEDRRGRMTAVADHALERRRKFEVFRQRAKQERQEAADRTFGSLKNRMTVFAKAAVERSAKLLAEHRIKVESDAVRVRGEADQQLERMLQRQRAEAITFEQSCSQGETELATRLRTVLDHQQRMQLSERESAQRMLEDTQSSLESKSHPALGGDGISDQGFHGTGWSRQGVVAELHRDMIALAKEVSMSLDDVKSSATESGGDGISGMKSEVRRLIDEREAVLKELRRHMDSQRESLRHDWLRLESLLATLASKADTFEKDVRKGRSLLTTQQARLDAVRSSWEAEGRKKMTEAFGGDGRPGSHGGLGGLPMSTESLLYQVVYELSVRAQQVGKQTRINAASRQKLMQSIATHEELMATKQVEVGRATMRVVESFEAIATTAAQLESKQQWMQREASDIEGARQQFQRDQQEFQRGVEVARDIAGRLQQLSSEAARAAQEQQQQHYQQRQQQQQQQQGGGGNKAPYLKRSSEADKYRHYYAAAGTQQQQGAPHASALGFSAMDVSQPSAAGRPADFSESINASRMPARVDHQNPSQSIIGGIAANRTLSSFQSLVPLEMDSMQDESRWPLMGAAATAPMPSAHAGYLSIQSSHPQPLHQSSVAPDAFGDAVLRGSSAGSATTSSSQAAAVETYRRLGVLHEGSSTSGAPSHRSASDGSGGLMNPTHAVGVTRYSLPTPSTSESGRGFSS